MSVCSRSLKCGLVFAAFAFGLGVSARPSLEEIDRILVASGSIENFLKDEAAQKNYYENLRAYFGMAEEKFSWKTFRFFLAQYKLVAEKVPGFNARMWETEHLGAEFDLVNPIHSEGVELNPSTWAAYKREWFEKIRLQAEPLLVMPESVRSGQIALRIENLRERTQRFFESIKDVSRPEGARLSAEFFQKVKAAPSLNELAAYLLWKQVQSEPLAAQLSSREADVVLQTLQRLRESAPGKGEYPEGLSTLVRALIPEKNELLSQTRIFSPEMQYLPSGPGIPLGSLPAGHYLFKPYPRRFHGIWKGIHNEECVGGAARHVKDLVPERWATVALADTRLFAVERDGHYLGFVQMVPIRKKNTEEIYGSIDFGSKVFSRRLVFESEGGFSTRNFFDLWLEAYSRTNGTAWRGLLMSENNTVFHNAGVLPAVRESLAFRFGFQEGHHEKFVHFDTKMPQQIVGLVLLGERVAHLSYRDMIFDAAHPLAGELRRFYFGEDFSWINDPAKVKDVLGISTIRPYFLARLLQVAPASERMDSVLQESLKDLSEGQRQTFLNCLKADVKNGILRLNRDFPVMDPHEIFSQDDDLLVRSQIDRSLKNSAPVFFSWMTRRGGNFWPRDLLMFSVKTSTDTYLLHLGLEYVKTPEDYIRLVGRDTFAIGNSFYREKLDRLVLGSFDQFLALSPTVAQLFRVLEDIQDVDVKIQIRKRSLDLIKSPSDYVEFFSRDSVSLDLRAPLSTLMSDTLETFLRLKPALKDIEALISIGLLSRETIESQLKALGYKPSFGDKCLAAVKRFAEKLRS